MKRYAIVLGNDCGVADGSYMQQLHIRIILIKFEVKV